jgi:hypothetical protein
MPNQPPKSHTPNPDNEGQALVISVLVVSFLLSITLTLSLLFLPKIRASSEIAKSSAALYAAESGLEWCLYVYRHGVVAAPIMANSAAIINGNTEASFVVSDCQTPNTSARAIGTYQGISRALEVGF